MCNQCASQFPTTEFRVIPTVVLPARAFGTSTTYVAVFSPELEDMEPKIEGERRRPTASGPRLRKTDNPFIPFIPEARLFRLWGKGGVYGINENKRIRLFAVNGVYRGGQGRLFCLWCGRRD